LIRIFNEELFIIEVVPKLQFWGDKLRKAGSLGFNRKTGVRPLDKGERVLL
jgi:hypothetical protein